jgi:hypothetical protein
MAGLGTCDITGRSGYVRLRGSSGRAVDIAGGPSLTDTVEKVSAKKLWNWNLKRWNPGK